MVSQKTSPAGDVAARTAPATPRASITLFVPGLLRDCCGGASELPFQAVDVRGALEEVERQYPSLYRSVCDETGAVRRHVNLFVNTDNTRDLSGLDTLLRGGDTIIILPAVSGG